MFPLLLCKVIITYLHCSSARLLPNPPPPQIAHDNLLFADLLMRVTTTTGGLLSSNEVFYTQKARLIRRLSFTIYCCEYNQYCKYISKIQVRVQMCPSCNIYRF